MKTKYSLLLAVILIFSGIKSYSSHLMGGNITYSYAGFNAATQLHAYVVRISMYRYCSPDSTTTTQFDAVDSLGIYIEDPLNPLAGKVRQGKIGMHVSSTQYLVPTSPGCAIGNNVCVEQAIYQDTIHVPSSIGGYHLIFDRCCRNAGISNLSNPGNDGEAYYAFIGPTAFANNSSTFATIPVPFVCAADTASVLNSAFDPDGDSLVYSFQTPYNGISGGAATMPPPPAVYNWPIPTVGYAATYSLANPFGPAGYANINFNTGLSSYYIPNTGFYVIAVQINEFRNGILVGITRRDIQLIAIQCPANAAPVLSNSGGSGQTSYTVDGGTNLCFPVTFNDADSMSVSATGLIFDTSLVNHATFTHSSGIGTSTSQFCWIIPCNNNTPATYQFVATALDYGCPHKTTNIVYTINVNQQTIAGITGPDTVCINQGTSTYSANSSTAASYHWVINGGTQTSGGTTGTISVNWTSATGSVSVYAINAGGCHSDTLLRNIVTYHPLAQAGIDVHFCTGGSSQIGSTPIPNQTYSWSPSTGLSSSTISNPVVSLTNGGASPVTTQYILTATLQGCTSSDTALVTVNPNPVVALAAFNSVCINVPAFTLTGGTPAGGTYSGAGVSGGIFSPSVAGSGPHTITYSYTNINGCSGSATSTITVNALPIVTLNLAVTQVCTNASSFDLTGGTPSGGTYSGAGVSGGIFNPTTAGLGPHVITYSYTNGGGCSASATSTITVNALPIVTLNLAVTHVCSNAAPVELTGGSPAGGTYSGVSVSGGLFNPATAGIGPHIITYTYTDGNGCLASATSTITVNALPVVALNLAVNHACENAAPVTLSGGTPAGGSYTGSGISGGILNPALSGIGTIAVLYSYTDISGCAASATSNFTVDPLPVVTLAPLSSCLGAAPFALTNGSPSGGAYSGPGVSGGIFDPTVAGLGTHNINYTFTNSGGCTSSASSTITVSSIASPVVTVSPGIGCQNNTIYIGYGPQSFTLTATNVSGVTYQWYQDGVLIPGATSSTLQVTTAGVYSVIVTNSGGCSSSQNPQSIAAINSVDIRCGQHLQKVVLCHVPPGNPGNPQTLCIAPSAVPAHLANHPGDCLGPCTLRLASPQDASEGELAVYPNPFFVGTNVDFEVFETANVFVGLYDLNGRLVQTLFDGVAEEMTSYKVQCNGANLSSGVYFIKMTAGDYAKYEKLIKF